MKAISSSLIVLLAMLSSMSAFSKQTPRELLLKYKWEAGRAYEYEMVAVAADKSEKKIYAMNIEALLCKDGMTLLAMWSPKRGNHVLFVSVSDSGQCIGERKISGEYQLPPADQANSFLMQEIGYLGMGYEKLIWEVPPTPLSVNSPVFWSGRNFRVVAVGNGAGNDIVTFMVEWSPAQTGQQHIRRFDLARGLLLTDQVATKDSGCWILRLKQVQNMNAAAVDKRKNEYEAAMDEDAVRLKLCRPFLTSTDNWTKRNAYMGLFAIHDENLQCTVYGEMVAAASDVGDSRLLAQSFLSKHLKRGAQWAVNVVEKEQWTKNGRNGEEECVYLGEREAVLSDLSGLDFGADRDKWVQWLHVIHPIFPKLKETETKDLLPQLTHDNPWVRLFVLKRLVERSKENRELDIQPILQKATQDVDNNVKTFAQRALNPGVTLIKDLHPFLCSTDPQNRLYAIRCIANNCKDLDPRPLLQKAALDPDAAVKAFAKKTLEELASSKAMSGERKPIPPELLSQLFPPPPPPRSAEEIARAERDKALMAEGKSGRLFAQSLLASLQKADVASFLDGVRRYTKSKISQDEAMKDPWVFLDGLGLPDMQPYFDGSRVVEKESTAYFSWPPGAFKTLEDWTAGKATRIDLHIAYTQKTTGKKGHVYKRLSFAPSDVAVPIVPTVKPGKDETANPISSTPTSATMPTTAPEKK